MVHHILGTQHTDLRIGDHCQVPYTQILLKRRYTIGLEDEPNCHALNESSKHYLFALVLRENDFTPPTTNNNQQQPTPTNETQCQLGRFLSLAEWSAWQTNATQISEMIFCHNPNSTSTQLKS